ncbi:MAG: efflux RND transporter periplasmic adaptor subunit [Sterolibacteriaceae bacterium]|nr:efflux RND transporter periplasmic adaptor subunit [Sterolibacteriaceae bacterium]MBK9085048.1 efflux RND transporter periplasmic adaptor subunit [Sterolibacteriaceae bacterium]
MNLRNAISLAAMLAAAPVFAAQPLACLIEPEQVAEVGSPVVGVIESIRVERGDPVQKGQILAVLRADLERAAVEVAQTRVEAAGEVRAAQASLDFAVQQRTRAEDLFEKKFISHQALDQARTEADVAEQKLVQARDQKRLSHRELGLATAQVAQRVIRSPIDGVVADRYLSPGERVEEKPLLRVAKVNPLRVQVIVPTSLYGRIQPGSSAMVLPELPNAAPASGRVTLVDKVVDAASNTFRVRLELPNPDLAVPAGLRCKADFGFEAIAQRAAPIEANAVVRPAVLKLESNLGATGPDGRSGHTRTY